MLLPLISLVLPTTLLAAPFSFDNPWGEYAPKCLADEKSLWDETKAMTKWYTVNLDAEPHDMWREIATEFKPKMQPAIDVVKSMVDGFGGEGAWGALLTLMDGQADKLTEPYRSEIHAMADLTEMDIRELTLLNLFFEVAAMCTSLVAMDDHGKVFHGRNLDFGVFYVWNSELHTWDLTRKLQDLVIQVEYQKEGKTLFKAVTFAGHLGIITAVKPGAFSLSIDTRFGSSLEAMTNFFLNGLEENQQFILYALRDMMTNFATFDEARHYIETEKLLRECYITMGHPNGGLIVTRNFNGFDHEAITDVKTTNGWYVLVTNYDWNEPDIFLDDRTNPGNKCMQQLGRKRVTKEGIFQVMSSQQNLNKSTVYTVIMEVTTGALYTFITDCKDPCWFV